MSGADKKDRSTLERLFATIEARRGGDPETSYTARLLAGGTPEVARKVGEEATECIVAALQGDGPETVRESADLLYHLLVLWADLGITPDEVFAELERREGVSGIEEKKRRT